MTVIDDPAAARAAADPVLALRGDVAVHDDGERIALTSPVGSFALRGGDPALTAALRGVAGPGAEIADLPEETRHRVLGLAGRLPALFVHGVRAGGGPLLATVEHTRRDGGYRPVAVGQEPVRLSRFALLRSHEGELVLESPLSGQRVRFRHPDARALVASLGASQRVGGPHGDLDGSDVSHLLGHLLGAGLLEEAGAAGAASDVDPTLRQWDFHDLLSHSRARSGRFDQPFGGVFPYRGEIDPQPALKPVPDGPAIALARPGLDELLGRDVALTTALEGRTSVRSYGSEPIGLAELGEFLYRTARVRALHGPSEAAPYEASTRPFPCGGAAYELELYVTVRRCAGLDAGVYYYDPAGHRLVALDAAAPDREAMLRTASVATGMAAVPDVLLTMTSRFQRLSWKYRAIAYSVSLKHAGVLYQTMYLVATSMGLAPCGLGSGDADLAARTFGLDPLHESSVGEFLLGSRPDTEPRTALPQSWRPVNDPGWGASAQAALRRAWAGAPDPAEPADGGRS